MNHSIKAGGGGECLVPQISLLSWGELIKLRGSDGDQDKGKAGDQDKGKASDQAQFKGGPSLGCFGTYVTLSASLHFVPYTPHSPHPSSGLFSGYLLYARVALTMG